MSKPRNSAVAAASRRDLLSPSGGPVAAYDPVAIERQRAVYAEDDARAASPPRPTCPAPGRKEGASCGQPVIAFGLCWGHYVRRRRHPGEPLRALGLPREEREARPEISHVRVSAKALAALREASSARGRPDLPLATAASEALEEWAEGWESGGLQDPRPGPAKRKIRK